MNANSERIEISRDLLEKAEKARSVLLPIKSELKYKKEYEKFLQWMEVNHMDSKNTSETVMLLSSTGWKKYIRENSKQNC